MHRSLRFALGLGVLALAGCTSLPETVERTPSTAFTEPLSTTLGREVAAVVARHGTHSGVALLDTGRQAFRQRLAMVEAAERSIDAQYYIWEADRTGRYLAARMLAAADRGVRVRVLLDDLGIGSKDEVLYALDTHPRIEIRLYNPLPAENRSGVTRLLAILGDFDRLAPRMHSKLMLVDGSAAIVGGRNIGDNYYDLHASRNFRDRDLLLAGPLVPRAGEAFDLTWSSWSSFPIAAVAATVPPPARVEAILDTLRTVDAAAAPPQPAPLSATAGRRALTRALQEGTWARAELLYNQPQGRGETASFDTPGPIAQRLLTLARTSRSSFLIESGYVISGSTALGLYRDLSERGVRVQVLTNSLASNDVVPLHAGYSRSRRALIERGVELHELRADAASCLQLVGAPERCPPRARLALHSKTAVFDRSVVYVGSFNFNPRSAFLNTEFAVIVHDEALGRRIAKDIELNLSGENSWRVDVAPDGRLRWRAQKDGAAAVEFAEPDATLWRRFNSGMFSLIPFEKYL